MIQKFSATPQINVQLEKMGGALKIYVIQSCWTVDMQI